MMPSDSNKPLESSLQNIWNLSDVDESTRGYGSASLQRH